MPEYVAKAWYKDAAMWLLIVTTLTGLLSDPNFGSVIPPIYLSKVMAILGAVGTLIRSISTARPVGWSDGSRSVTVGHMPMKVKDSRDSDNG